MIWHEVGTDDPPEADVEHVNDPGFVTAVNPVIDAPLADPGVHETVTDPAPVVVAVTEGALGGAAGVTETEVDTAPVPMAFEADTLNE